ncbi:MAG TPA: hypothetical protein VEI97_01010 [bacterium]|nr:hypothetical protein [bacterium]
MANPVKKSATREQAIGSTSGAAGLPAGRKTDKRNDMKASANDPEVHRGAQRAAAKGRTWDSRWLGMQVQATLVDETVLVGRLLEVDKFGVVIHVQDDPEAGTNQDLGTQVLIPRDSLYILEYRAEAPTHNQKGGTSARPFESVRRRAIEARRYELQTVHVPTSQDDALVVATQPPPEVLNRERQAASARGEGYGMYTPAEQEASPTHPDADQRRDPQGPSQPDVYRQEDPAHPTHALSFQTPNLDRAVERAQSAPAEDTEGKDYRMSPGTDLRFEDPPQERYDTAKKMMSGETAAAKSPRPDGGAPLSVDPQHTPSLDGMPTGPETENESGGSGG